MATVVIIEDDHDIRRLLAALLRLQGHEVSSCATACEGLAAIRSDPAPEIAVIDLMLPDGCGAELVEPAKRRGCRVAVATGVCDPVAMLGLATPGIILRKPFNFDELSAWLRTALD